MTVNIIVQKCSVEQLPQSDQYRGEMTYLARKLKGKPTFYKGV